MEKRRIVRLTLLFRVLDHRKFCLLDVDQASYAEDALGDPCFLKVSRSLRHSSRCRAQIHRWPTWFHRSNDNRNGRKEARNVPLTVYTDIPPSFRRSTSYTTNDRYLVCNLFGLSSVSFSRVQCVRLRHSSCKARHCVQVEPESSYK